MDLSVSSVTGAIVFSMDVQHIGYRYRTGVRCVCGGHRELVGRGAVGSESHDASLYPEPAVCTALHLAAKERQHGSLVVPGFLRGIADCLLRVLCSLFCCSGADFLGAVRQRDS